MIYSKLDLAISYQLLAIELIYTYRTAFGGDSTNMLFSPLVSAMQLSHLIGS